MLVKMNLVYQACITRATVLEALRVAVRGKAPNMLAPSTVIDRRLADCLHRTRKSDRDDRDVKKSI